MKFYDILGWVGITLALTAYGLISLEWLSSDDLVYPLLNIFAAAGIIASSWPKRDYQPIALNVAWGLIAVVTLAKIFV